MVIRRSLLWVVALAACLLITACAVPTSPNQPAAAPTGPVPTVSPVEDTASASQLPADLREQTNLAVVKRFYDEYSAGRAEVIFDTHATTITMHYAGDAEPVPAQALADDLAALKQANPDLHAEIHDMFASGPYVFTELTWTTTHTGDYFGVPATGMATSHPGIVVRRLEDGKIVESWEMWDDLTFLNSIGYLGTWDEIIAGGGVSSQN